MDLQNLFLPLLIVLFAIPLVLQARKQKRTMQAQQKLQNSLGVGDRVMTTSGLIGTVVGTSDDKIDLEISSGVTTTWLRQAIREKVDTENESAEQDQAAEETGSAEQAQVAETSQDAEKVESTEKAQDAEKDQDAGKAQDADASAETSGSAESGSEAAVKSEEQKTT